MTRPQLISELKSMNSIYPEEQDFQQLFLDLLKSPNAYQRDHLPGHITGSAWIVNQDHTKALLVLHAKLGRWLQPGGHADGEEDVLNVALREAEEETGLKKIHNLSPSVFDVDIHKIPARKDFPEHFHYDVRFVFQASEKDPLLISDESTDLKWIPLVELGTLTGDAPAIMRMVSKTRTL